MSAAPVCPRGYLVHPLWFGGGYCFFDANGRRSSDDYRTEEAARSAAAEHALKAGKSR